LGSCAESIFCICVKKNKKSQDSKFALTKHMSSAFIQFVFLHPRRTGDDPPLFLFISSRLVYSLLTNTGGAMRQRMTEGENEITKCRVTSTLGSRRQHGLLCNLAAPNTISFLPTASGNDSKSSLCNLGKQQPPKLNRWHKVFS